MTKLVGRKEMAAEERRRLAAARKLVDNWRAGKGRKIAEFYGRQALDKPAAEEQELTNRQETGS